MNINDLKNRMMMVSVERFIVESNEIEGINRSPYVKEIKEHLRFLDLPEVTIDDLIQFVSVYQPDATIRSQPYHNVTVGNHVPPRGGMSVILKLEELLKEITTLSPYDFHIRYEKLHPFTDGNGRSGRVLWAWQMQNQTGDKPSSFLQHWYYQSLEK